MLAFTESLRYEYPLNRASVVLDLGAFHGNFARLLHDRYGCIIHAFEPVKQFFDDLPNKVPKEVKIYPYGIGGSTRTEYIGIHGCASNIFSEAADKEAIQIRSLKSVMEELGIEKADLIKINIEGCEYELLEHMIQESLIPKFTDLQIQFHVMGVEPQLRREKIREWLAKTHELTYDEPFIWENWHRK